MTITSPEKLLSKANVADTAPTAPVQKASAGLAVPTLQHTVPSSQEDQDGLEMHRLLEANIGATPQEHASLVGADSNASGNDIQGSGVNKAPPGARLLSPVITSDPPTKTKPGRVPRKLVVDTTPAILDQTTSGPSAANTEVQVDIPRKTRAMTNLQGQVKPKPKTKPKQRQRKGIPRSPSSSLSPPP